MKLIVKELDGSNEVFQEIIPARNTIVEAVRPHLYLHNCLLNAAELTLEFQDSEGELIASSAAQPVSSISSSDFFHGHVRFYVNAHLKAGTTYRIAIKASSYTFSEASYVGVCSSFDLSAYEADYSPSSGFHAPLDIEIWQRK